MAKSFDQFQAQRDAVLQDAAVKLAPGDRDKMLLQAILQRYSKDRPRERVTDTAGNGTALIAVPAGFEDGFSIITSIEFPIGNVPPSRIRDDEWQMYRDTSALKVMLLATKPAASDQLRLTWTARHADDGSTVPEPDFEAVCDFAAALCFEALAASYAQTSDPSILADTVNYRTKSQEYLGLAKAARKRYADVLGIDDGSGGIGPAFAVGDLHGDLAGLDRLTHPKATR